MDWAPVSRERFAEIVPSEAARLEPDPKQLYEQYAVEPFYLPCFRSQDYGVEQVFVVAKNGNRLLYFDDVEDEFGVSIPDADGVMREWGNYDLLVQALLALDGDQAHASFSG